MEETIISWNVANWVTIVLMAAIGFALLAFVQKYVQSRSQTSEAS